METYKFGEAIVTRHILKKEHGPRRNQIHWEQHFIPETVVRVIGIRSLRNGIYHVNEDEYYFEPSEYIKAALVVKNLKEKPFYIKLNA